MTVPSHIGRWQVQDELGQGTFATVYLARSGDVEAAIKVCTTEHEAAAERIQFEISALRRLEHPNIPTFLGDGTVDGKPYVVMSFVNGMTLKERIEENLAVGRLYGDIEALRSLRGLFQALVHVHKVGLVHRDIKDANIVLADNGMSMKLIDFGFCKEIGVARVRSDDSFWRVGAARYSPPAKLGNPGLAHPSHDVFACGVLAYRMLTGEFPWSVPRGDDFGELRHVMLTRPLEPVSEINSHVYPAVVRWVSKLLDLDDANRPSAQAALDELDAMLDTAHQVGAGTRRRTHRTEYPHVLRDPVHRDIRLTDYEYSVLGTAELQRLRSIRQLGLTNMIYPGAEHTRFSHALGCVARVEQILRTIEDKNGRRIDPELRTAARLFALTHDVLHVPLGTTLEDELGVLPPREENHARADRLVLRDESELGKLLRETDIGRAVITHFPVSPGNTPKPAFVDLVLNVAGAAALDYIDRDAYFCGLDHCIDTAIFRQFTLYPLPQVTEQRLMSRVGGKYGLRVDREFLVESVLKERYAMYLKVYTHPAKIAASALLGKAMFEAMGPRTGGGLPLKEEAIEWMGDSTLLDRLSSSKREVVRSCAKQIMFRRFPRGVYRGLLLAEGHRDEESYRNRRAWLQQLGATTPEGRAELERELASDARLHPRQVIVYCPVNAPGYQQAEHWVSERGVPTNRADGLGEEIARRHLGLWELWVFLADVEDKAMHNRVADLAQYRFGMPNMIQDDRLQGRLF